MSWVEIEDEIHEWWYARKDEPVEFQTSLGDKITVTRIGAQEGPLVAIRTVGKNPNRPRGAAWMTVDDLFSLITDLESVAFGLKEKNDDATTEEE